MLIFFDESFRKSLSLKDKSIGVLCGVGIAEEELHSVVADIFQLKYKHCGAHFARNVELKGKMLFKDYLFRLESRGIESKQLSLGGEILDYIVSKKLPVFGCVCFEDGFRMFKCANVTSLDKTFFYIFERIHIYLKIEHRTKFGKIVFDDRGYKINKQNAETITNFFVRSPQGLAMDNIVKTPFFAISQAQNVGLQLADVVTSVIGLKFARSSSIEPYWQRLKPAFYNWQKADGMQQSSLKILRESKKKGLDDSSEPLSGQESLTSNPRDN